MNLSQIDLLASGAAILAVWACGVSRIKVQIRLLALQTAFLAAICLLLGLHEGSTQLLLLSGVVLLVKAVGIPVFLQWSARHMDVERDRGTGVNLTPGLIIGAGLLAVGYFMAPQFAVPGMGNSGSAGMGFALMLLGMLQMTSRRLALSQVIGFLCMENGIFLYSLTQTKHMPILLEMGSVFEVLIAVMIAGMVLFRINRSFEHIDVTDMRELRH
ncbi:MAG: hypothetical protein ACYC1M_15320 [Armatimonadota bacterium]